MVARRWKDLPLTVDYIDCCLHNNTPPTGPEILGGDKHRCRKRKSLLSPVQRLQGHGSAPSPSATFAGNLEPWNYRGKHRGNEAIGGPNLRLPSVSCWAGAIGTSTSSEHVRCQPRQSPVTSLPPTHDRRPAVGQQPHHAHKP